MICVPRAPVPPCPPVARSWRSAAPSTATAARIVARSESGLQQLAIRCVWKVEYRRRPQQRPRPEFDLSANGMVQRAPDVQTGLGPPRATHPMGRGTPRRSLRQRSSIDARRPIQNAAHRIQSRSSPGRVPE